MYKKNFKIEYRDIQFYIFWLCDVIFLYLQKYEWFTMSKEYALECG